MKQSTKVAIIVVFFISKPFGLSSRPLSSIPKDLMTSNIPW